jgi:predicted RNase H-like nuclease (RuvC/YqgF family)
MNKFLFFNLFIFISSLAQGQTITVNKQNEKVKGETIEVFALSLEGKKENIKSAWIKYLKEMGKLKLLGSPMTVSEPVISGTPFNKGIVYAGTNEGDKTSTVWMGINSKEWEDKDVTYANRELQKMISQFGIKFYRDQVQVQINETQQALDAVAKQQQRLLNQNKDLTIKLGNNEQEKIQLEKSLESNKLENAALKIRLENNKKAQDSLVNSTDQIKKIMELHKEKQRKIN